jgi:hypothetical protein
MGVELTLTDDGRVAGTWEDHVITGQDGKAVLDAIEKAMKNGEVDDEGEAEAEAEARVEAEGEASDVEGDENVAEDSVEDAEPETRSVVKPKYRKRYLPHQDTNGDDLARELKEFLFVEGDDGELHLDVAHLQRFAKANDVWKDEYRHLNPGMQRMNCVNRLRAKVRKGHEIRWAK